MRTVIALTLASIVTLAAQAGDQRRSISFVELDRNADGRISMPESNASPTLNGAFATVDRDRDAYVNEQEFEGWAGEQQITDARPQLLPPPGEVTDDGRIEAPRIERW
jgi:hypothetical protein